MKYLSFILTAMLCISFSIQNFAQIKFETYSTAAIKKAASEKKLILITFTAGWCGSCRLMKKEVFDKADVSDFYHKNFVNISVDADYDKNGLLVKYDIEGLPAYVFLDANEQLLYKNSGQTDAKDFIDKGNYAIKKSKGTLTEEETLYGCMEQKDFSCSGLLDKFIKSSKWTTDEAAAILLLEFAANGSKTALNHVMEHKNEYLELLGSEIVNNALLRVALEDVRENLIIAFDKNSDPDWVLIKNTLVRYMGNDCEKEFLDLKSQYYFDLGKMPQFIQTEEAIVKIAENEKSGEALGQYLLDNCFSILEIFNSSDNNSKEDEKLLANFVYNCLKKAETLLEDAPKELFYELWDACDILEKETESDYYYAVYKLMEKGDSAAEAKEKSK